MGVLSVKIKKNKELIMPTSEEIKKELDRENYKRRYTKVLRSTLFTLIVVAAVAVLVATIWMPVLQIYGSSMSPTLSEGEIVVSVKGGDFEAGDLVCFISEISFL